MKILVVTKNWLGDILFQLPAIETIAKKYPQAELVCLSPQRGVPILIAQPYVSRVLVFDEKKEHRSWWNRWLFTGTLRKEKFNQVYFLQRSTTRAFLTWMAGIPERIGYASRRSWLLTQAVAEPKNAIHHVDYFLALLKGIGFQIDLDVRYRFQVQEKDRQSIQLKLKDKIKTPYLCMHLGANWEPKRWPAEHFADLARLILEKTDLSILVTGSQEDQVLWERFSKKYSSLRIECWMGKTSLGELAALFEKSAAVISSDSGPMHIASGVGASVAAIFGPTDPALTGPRGWGKILVIHHVPPGLACPWYGEPFPKQGWLEHLSPQEVYERLEQAGWLNKDRALSS